MNGGAPKSLPLEGGFIQCFRREMVSTLNTSHLPPKHCKRGARRGLLTAISCGSQIQTGKAASNGVIPSEAEREWSGVEGSKSSNRAVHSDLSTAVRLWLTFGRDDSVCLMFSISVRESYQLHAARRTLHTCSEAFVREASEARSASRFIDRYPNFTMNTKCGESIDLCKEIHAYV